MSQPTLSPLSETCKTPRANIFREDASSATFGEFYVPRTGVAYSDPDIHDFFQQYDSRPESPHTTRLGEPISRPWLESETSAVLEDSATASMIILEGDLGAGKSTVLFGLKTLLREAGQPYTKIDGHFLNRGRAIANAIKRATRLGQPVLYDSLDYLYLGKNRKKPASQARPIVTQAITEHLDSGGLLVGTVHTSPWLDRLAVPELRPEIDKVLNTANVHRVHGYIAGAQELGALCTKIVDVGYASVYEPLAANSGEATARTYRVAKLLGRQVGGAVGLSELPQCRFDELIREIDDTTRAKMGASPDYSLLPNPIHTHAT